MLTMKNGRLIIKVGGSLYDLPDLSRRLQQVLFGARSSQIVLIPGGGDFAEAVRRLDELHRLSADVSHRLGIASMSLAARFLVAILSGCRMVCSRDELQSCWDAACVAIADLANWDEPLKAHRLPASWDVTSDSLAAAVAEELSGDLLLLKSVDLSCPQLTWEAASAEGLVDRYFPTAAAKVGRVCWMNLRSDSPTTDDWSGSTPDVMRNSTNPSSASSAADSTQDHQRWR
ncbi:amino acid kinase family protein [Planctomicrobium sp. SH664]|uniref:amino acid kinase family protein n=1 Tax=Planctomicrobium sp. SH664 TaxID=3448125 RepID=UPI003F5B04DB